MLVPKTKRLYITTDSMHFYYRSPNLIENLTPTYAGRGMLLSTIEKYDPYRNAVAERINGILKYEFGMVKTIADVKLAKKIIAEAVEIYNKKRRHRSLGMSTPDQAHKNNKHVYKFYG